MRNEKMKVREIMSRPVVSEDEETVVVKIAKEMAELGVGSVVVTSGGEPPAAAKPAGIVTERDIALKVLLKDKRASEVRAREIMSSPLVTVAPEASVEEACDLALAKGIKRLPVVENGVLVGLVSVRNILTRKPEFVKRFYPEVRVLASGWTLDRLERSLSECEVLLAAGDEESIKKYRAGLKEVCDELSRLVCTYADDEELGEIFASVKRLWHEHETETGAGGEGGEEREEQRRRLEAELRKFRHTTFWRKQQATSSLASGIFSFHDYRHTGGGGRELRLPFKRTR